MVGLFIHFSDETKLVNINVGDDRESTNIFSANRRNPDGTGYFSHKSPLSPPIIDCTSEPTISELDGGVCQLKRNALQIFYRASWLHQM